MNLGHTSYGLKHVVENYTDDALGKHNYVMVLCALLQ
jgi:hypothetical protein